MQLAGSKFQLSITIFENAYFLTFSLNLFLNSFWSCPILSPSNSSTTAIAFYVRVPYAYVIFSITYVQYNTRILFRKVAHGRCLASATAPYRCARMRRSPSIPRAAHSPRSTAAPHTAASRCIRGWRCRWPVAQWRALIPCLFKRAGTEHLRRVVFSCGRLRQIAAEVFSAADDTVKSPLQ